MSGLENANIQIIFIFEFIYEQNASYKNDCRTQKRQITYSRLQFKLDLAKFTRDSFFVSAKRNFFCKKRRCLFITTTGDGEYIWLNYFVLVRYSVRSIADCLASIHLYLLVEWKWDENEWRKKDKWVYR